LLDCIVLSLFISTLKTATTTVLSSTFFGLLEYHCFDSFWANLFFIDVGVLPASERRRASRCPDYWYIKKKRKKNKHQQ